MPSAKAASRKCSCRKKTSWLKSWLDAFGIYRVLEKIHISWKIRKGRVKKNRRQNGSKACACRTCAPCKGLRPVDPTPSAQAHLKVQS